MTARRGGEPRPRRGARTPAGVVRVLRVARPPSRSLLHALAGFGLAVAGPRSRSSRAVCRVLAAMHEAGGVALVVGASGAGKSRFLRSLRDACEHAGRSCSLTDLAHTPLPDAPNLLDAVREVVASPGTREPDATQGAIALLTRAGLADAVLLARAPRELSEGERARLRLALALGARAGVGHASLLLLDEFASVLDRATARGVCVTLARWVRAGGCGCVVVATAHEDVAGWLEPDVVVRCRTRGTPRVTITPRAERAA